MKYLLIAAIVCQVHWPCRMYRSGSPVRRRDALVCFAHSTHQRYPRHGYVVDHIKPLACGGCDVPSNMQWQTIAEGKAKDKIERNNCK